MMRWLNSSEEHNGQARRDTVWVYTTPPRDWEGGVFNPWVEGVYNPPTPPRELVLISN